MMNRSKSIHEVCRKVWIYCDRDRELKEPRNSKRRHIINRKINYSFHYIATFVDEIVWHIEVSNLEHNHDLFLIEAHLTLRKIVLKKHKNDITRQLIVQIKFFNVLLFLRIANFVKKSTMWNDVDNSQIVNFIFSNKDIYNFKIQMRRDALKFLTFIQKLIQKFNNDDNWKYQMKQNDEHQVIHLFFVNEITRVNFLRNNFEIIIMNCIYKIYRFKMSLLIINEQTTFYINFYIEFCFMLQKEILDYIWTLIYLMKLYQQLRFFLSSVAVINMKMTLMTTIDRVISFTRHFLCLWHVNKNVLVKCKQNFDIKETWNEFYNEWKSIIYVKFEIEFRKLWNRFCFKHIVVYVESIEYLFFIYIISYSHCLIKCYINQVLHFETTSTSKDEDNHAILKRQLSTSNNDLKEIMNDIKILFMNQHQSHLIVINSIKDWLFMKLRKLIFDLLIDRVISYALRKVNN